MHANIHAEDAKVQVVFGASRFKKHAKYLGKITWIIMATRLRICCGFRGQADGIRYACGEPALALTRKLPKSRKTSEVWLHEGAVWPRQTITTPCTQAFSIPFISGTSI